MNNRSQSAKKPVSRWNLNTVAGALSRFWWTAALATLAGGAAAYGLASGTPPVYHSTARLFVSIDRSTSGSDLNQGSAYTQSQMLSFAELGESSLVLEPVIKDLGLETSLSALRSAVQVRIAQDTVILNITASSGTAQSAAQVANAVSNQLAEAVEEISPVGANGASSVTARTIEAAMPPVFQTSPDVKRTTLTGALAGFLLGVLGAIVLAVFDKRLRTVEDLGEVANVPILGQVPASAAREGSSLWAAEEPNGLEIEPYRRLRAGLRFAAGDGEWMRLAVTSALAGEGKTTVATNLALAMAETGQRVLLVDADLRRPRIHEYLQLAGAPGLTDVVRGGAEFRAARQVWGGGALHVLSAGEALESPAEILASAGMRDLLAARKGEYDVVIIDTAPVLSVSDATQLAQYVDATLVVADAKRSRRTQLHRALRLLDVAGAHVVGVVLNRAKVPAPVPARIYS